jgi:glycosyltransferase involved in cell wall biosynthesis
MNDVSAVIPVYNGESFIEDAILSIIDQMIPNNIIIVDDGSLDNSVHLVKKFGKIRIIENSFRSGVSAAINLGANSVETPYFIIQGADDVSFSNRILIQRNYLKQTGATCVIGAPKTINSEGLEIVTDVFNQVSNIFDVNFVELFNSLNYLCAPAASFNTHKFLNIGGFDEYLLQLQDFKLWLDLAIINEIKYIPEYVVKYRLHENNLSNIFSHYHKNRMLNETEAIYRFFMNRLCLDIKAAQVTFSQKFESRESLILHLLKLYLNHPNYFVRVLGFKLILETSMYEELKEDIKHLCNFPLIDYISNSGIQFPDI